MTAFFITGTDTDVGKTVVAAGLLKAFTSMGIPARALKPVQTGCAAHQSPDGSHYLEAPDVMRWRKAGGQGEAIEKFAAPVSPHLAARLEGKRLNVESLARECRQRIGQRGLTLLEGAGGLYVPINESEFMLDFAKALRMPMLLVVGNRLGCINSALLSLNAMEGACLTIAGVILCRANPPEEPDAGTNIEAESQILAENREFLEKEGRMRGAPLLAALPYFQELRTNPDLGWNRLAKKLAGAAHYLAHIFPASRHESRGAI